ncbi:MAG: c-type cytochrome, methanol metabolism-related [Paracoccus sp. (in: a-proteobacteria)]|nr:c-type cytochrome, methanol metabolism-related [Paracoccus sp. (in: a-proteobacteria)]
MSNRIVSVMALSAALGLAAPLWAQDAAPSDAGAGAAAVSANAASTKDAATATGATVMPSGHDITPDYQENGIWYNAEGIPTFNVEDGVVDWATFSGFRRYHAECHVCHGPDGEGSTYAPALKNSAMTMDYYDFMQVVASGRQSTNSVMPAFGTNRNVWCYINDIYVYLLAHGTDTIPRGRPAQRADKPDDYAEMEAACMDM